MEALEGVTISAAMTAPGMRTSCRACGGTLSVILADLGVQPPSNAFLDSLDEAREERRYPLRARVCGSCRLVQLDEDVAPAELFRNYVYFSSYSDEWLAHARAYCAMARERFALGAASRVVELASNDGYLLKNFLEMGIPVLGIDPSDTVARAAERIGVPTRVRFFGAALARELVAEGIRADLVIANNVLAHVPDLNDFLEGIAFLLAPGGSATLEFPHLARLIAGVEFDTIYHEHYSYFSLIALERALAARGLRAYDVEELSTHGGSLRLYVARADSAALPRLAKTPRLEALRAAERAAGLDDLDTYRRFAAQVASCREALRAFLAAARRERRSVLAYGAAAKGNTLLNFCGLTAQDIPLVADRNPHKQGKLLPGSHIPVVAPAALIERRPDYVLILPWNLEHEIRTQLADVHARGGRFVLPVPVTRVVG